MPVLPSAKKALRRDQRRTQVNNTIRSRMRTIIKKVEKTKDAALLPQLYTAVDTAAKKNVIHSNKAARIKSRLNRLVKEVKKK